MDSPVVRFFHRCRDAASAFFGSRAWLVGRAVISLTIIGYLVVTVDWSGVGQTLSGADPWILAIAPVVYFLSSVCGALRWYVLLSVFNQPIPLLSCLKYYLVAAFYATFLPGEVAGDVVRIGLASSRPERSVGYIASNVALERVIGLAVLFLMGGLGVALLPDETAAQIGDDLTTALSVAGLTFGMGLGITIAVLPLIGPRLVSLFGKVRYLDRLQDLVSVIVQAPRRSLIIVAISSLVVQLLVSVSYFFLAEAIHISVPWALFLVLAPAVQLATIMPVSVGGVGVREGTAAFLLTQVGVPLDSALPFGFLIYGNVLCIAAIGGVLELLAPVRKRIANRQQAETR